MITDILFTVVAIWLCSIVIILVLDKWLYKMKQKAKAEVPCSYQEKEKDQGPFRTAAKVDTEPASEKVQPVEPAPETKLLDAEKASKLYEESIDSMLQNIPALWKKVVEPCINDAIKEHKRHAYIYSDQTLTRREEEELKKMAEKLGYNVNGTNLYSVTYNFRLTW